MNAAATQASDRWCAAGLFFVLAAWFSLFAQGTPDVVDAEIAHQTASAMVRAHSTAVQGTPEAQELVKFAGQAAPGAFPLVQGPDGGWRGWYAPGQALLLVPLYVLGAALAAASPWLTGPRAERVLDGVARSEWWEHAATSLSNPLYSAALAAALYLSARHLRASRRAACCAVVGLALGTFVAPLSRGMLSDIPAAAALAWAMERFYAQRACQALGAAPSWWGLGAGLAIAVSTRVQLAPAAAIIGVVVVWSAPQRLVAARQLGVCALAAMAVVLSANVARSGRALDFGYGAVFAGGFFALAPWEGAWKLWFSSGRGLVWYSSGVLLALAGWWLVRAQRRTELVVVLAAALAVGLPVCSMVAWHGAHAPGPRYVLAAVVLVWPALALLFDAVQPLARRVLQVWLCVSVVAYVPWMVVDSATWHALALEHQRGQAHHHGSTDEQLFQAAMVDWRSAPLVTVPQLAVAQFSPDATDADGKIHSFASLLPPERARHMRHLLWVEADSLGVPFWVPMGWLGLLLGLALLAFRKMRLCDRYT